MNIEGTGLGNNSGSRGIFFGLKWIKKEKNYYFQPENNDKKITIIGFMKNIFEIFFYENLIFKWFKIGHKKIL